MKEEVERLEKLRAEFENVDEDGEIEDDEFFKDLNKRLGKGEEKEEDGGEDEGKGAGRTVVSEDGGVEGGEDSAGARDMLKRMFDASEEGDKKNDDDEKKDKDK